MDNCTRFQIRCDKTRQAESTEIISNLDGSLYSILFNANEDRHSYDMRRVYSSLINAGVGDSHISALEGDGKTRNRFVNKSATIENLYSAIDSVRQKANSNDRLLVYVTNHGFLKNGQSVVSAHDGFIWEKDFEEMAQDLPVNFGLFYFAQCHAGGFAERMGYGKNVGMSITSKKEKSLGHAGIGNCFTNHLFPRILKKYTIIEDAFDVAAAMEERVINGLGYWKEIPQLKWQNANPSRLYLNPSFQKLLPFSFN